MQNSRVGLAVVATVAVALMLLMLVWAAGSGVGVLATGGPRAQTAVPTATASASQEPGRVRHERARREPQQQHPVDLSWLGETIEVVLLLALGLLLLRWGRWVRERLAEESAEPRLAAGFDLLPDAADLADRIAADREEHRARLAEGTPRNGIVQCWVLFQEAATGHGLPPLPTETSTEYLTRLLHLLDVDPRPAARLAGLYHEARFSTHPLTEEHRVAAREALDALHADLASLRRVHRDADEVAR